MIRSIFWYSYLYTFVFFGGITFFILFLLPLSKKFKTQQIKNIARFWARSLVVLSGSKLKVFEEAPLKENKNYLLCANHQSSFDIFILMGFLNKDIIFLSKHSYFKIPIFGWAMKSLGHLPINRKHPKQAIQDLLQVNKKLATGMSLAIFPEGTRSLDAGIQPFKSAWLRILETKPQLEVIPVSLVNTISIQQKGRLKINPASVAMVLGKSLCFSHYLSAAEVPKSSKHALESGHLRSQEISKKKLSAIRSLFIHDLKQAIKNNYARYEKLLSPLSKTKK